MPPPDSPQGTKLERFFAFLVQRPVAVLMVVLALLGMGTIAATKIPIELQPSGFASSRIWVSVPWPGANPQELEKQVLRPVEEEMRTIRGVQEILSFASPSSGGILVAFPGSTDMDLAYAEVADRVERVRPQLPRDVDRISIRRWTTADTPIMWAGILYPPENKEAAQDTLSEVFQPRLEAVDGVANVELHGIEPRSVRILLDEDRVHALGIDIGDLVGRLQQDNISAPVGDLDDSGSRFIVRVDGRFDSIEEIEDVPVRRGLTLKDIGRVALVRDDPTGLFRMNGQGGLGVMITKESSANTFEVCKRVQELIEEEIPDDPILGAFQYRIFWNSGRTIADSLRALVTDAGTGGLIACVVLMLFLRRLRYTLLIAVSIPFSVIITLSYLYFAGDSFNLFSMMGITVAIGMLVDNSVVIVESIFKRREQGQSIYESVTKGPADVMLAVVTATLTSVVVFLPLIFMSENRNARLFTTSIGVPLCVSLLAALLLAIVIVPVASRFFSSDRGSQTKGPPPRESWLSRRFGHLVHWSLQHRFLALALAAIFFQSGIVAGSSNKTQDDIGGFGGQMEIDFEFASNTTLEAADEEARAVEAAILPLREQLGSPFIGVEFSRRGGSLYFWYDKDVSPDREKEYKKLLKEKLPVRAAIEYELESGFDKQNTEDKKWLRLTLEGPDTAVIARIADEVRERARASGNFEEVAEEDDPAREVLVTFDRERLQKLGVSSESVLRNLEWTLRGFMISRIETRRGDIPLLIEYDEDEEPTRFRLQQMLVAGRQSETPVPLAALASFEAHRGPRSIFRQNGKTTEVIGLKAKDKDLKKQSEQLQALMAGITMPEGCRWRQSGGWNSFQDDMKELVTAMFLAIALVFFLMGLLFESLLLPLSVLFTIPFAVAGANWAFLLTGTPIDIVGWIGMIVLAGVVVNNGIVLLDRILRLERSGLDRQIAIVQGVKDRLRPVLMTALTTISGLLPIALSEPTGNSISFRSLAIGVAGGLACTTFFTLWVVPLVYSLLDDFAKVIRGLLGWRPREFVAVAVVEEEADEAAVRAALNPSSQ